MAWIILEDWWRWEEGFDGCSGLWLGLVRLLSVTGGCGLLAESGSGAGGMAGVNIYWIKVVARGGCGQGCSVRVALGGSKGGEEALVLTISHLVVIGCRCWSMHSKIASSFSIDWSQSLRLSSMQLMVCRRWSVHASID